MSGASYSQEGYLHENYRCFHLRDSLGQERDFHFHDFYKIVIHLSGLVDYQVERMTYRLRPGDILLIKHHVIHRAAIDMSQPYERFILYLDGPYTERAMPGAALLECFEQADRQGRYLLKPSEQERQRLTAHLETLESSLNDRQFGAQALRDTLVIQLLVLINRISFSQDASPADAVPQYDPKIAQTLSYINENLSQDLTVERLAERVYLSKYHFMRLFKSQTGSTVHAYVRQRRLLYAAQLIRRGVPAGKAAEDCGFEEYSTFFRAFRECFGLSPGQLK